MNAAKKLAKEAKGWWGREDGGALMRDMESTQSLTGSVLDNLMPSQRHNQRLWKMCLGALVRSNSPRRVSYYKM